MFVDLSMRCYRCLFIVHANEREVINYHLTRVDEGGRECIQLVEGPLAHARPYIPQIDAISDVYRSPNNSAASFVMAPHHVRYEQWKIKIIH